MLEAQLSHFAQLVPVAVAQSATRQGLAKILREAARPLVQIARPRGPDDVARLDAAVWGALADVPPDIAAFARARVREIAMLPWQTAFIDAGGYAAWPVLFDGTNDYLSRGANLTGASDSTLWTGSVWFRRTAVSGATQKRIFLSTTIANAVNFTTADKLQILGRNSASTTILQLLTTAAFTDTNWHHAMWSCDLTDTGKRHLYIDDASDLSVSTYTNDTINWAGMTDAGIGAAATTGNNKSQGDYADMQMWFDTYVDLSQVANRRLFITGSGAPVNPAVAAASLGTPIVAMTAQTTAAWHTNNGGGGGFTENGALTDGTGPVHL